MIIFWNGDWLLVFVDFAASSSIPHFSENIVCDNEIINEFVSEIIYWSPLVFYNKTVGQTTFLVVYEREYKIRVFSTTISER